jgi:hypothetical protein
MLISHFRKKVLVAQGILHKLTEFCTNVRTLVAAPAHRARSTNAELELV